MAPPQNSKRTPPVSNYGNLYRLASMGYELVVAIIVMGAIGFGLDYLFNSKPWLLISGMILGIFVGLYRFYREARRAVSGTDKLS